MDLQDERDVRQRGFDLIYEARDLDLDQSTRDGLTQYRKNADSTKARVKEAERILDNNLDPLIKKKYWCAPLCHLQQACSTLYEPVWQSEVMTRPQTGTVRQHRSSPGKHTRSTFDATIFICNVPPC